MKPLEELSYYLRPPGQGIYTVSTGKKELESFTASYLGSSNLDWKSHLHQITTLPDFSVVMLAVPCDTGCGIVRGCSRGPEAMRKYWKKAPCFDLGDVIVVPHILEDSMVSKNQIKDIQKALYPTVKPDFRKKLFVSPMSITRRVYFLIKKINPTIKIIILGGDHSFSWPAVDMILNKTALKKNDTAIVVFDAHTDLLKDRMGVKYCFATWAFHAIKRLGGKQRMIQIGIRSSGKDKKHWENLLGVKQIWGSETISLKPDELADIVVNHLKKIKAKNIYISNDIDGTDSSYAGACGTPEKDGLTRDQVLAVIQKVKHSGFNIIGSDMMELAPVLGLSEEVSFKSVETACLYTNAMISAMQD